MTQDLGGILDHMDKLNELDTSNVEPMTQVLFEQDETATLRKIKKLRAFKRRCPCECSCGR